MDNKVLQFVKEGKSIREISRLTGIDRCTIKYQLAKLEIKSIFKQGQRPKNFKSLWFKGYTKTTPGYKIIKNKEHPHANKQGYVLEHRLVMERHLDRYLTKEEVVHHRNEIKSDNYIENLFLFPNDELHRCFHMLNKYVSEKLSPEEFMEVIHNGVTNAE